MVCSPGLVPASATRPLADGNDTGQHRHVVIGHGTTPTPSGSVKRPPEIHGFRPRIVEDAQAAQPVRDM